MSFDSQTSPLYLKIRQQKSREKVDHPFGPINGKNYMLAPQMGLLRGLSGKSQSGKSLKGNIKSEKILSGFAPYVFLKTVSYDELLRYLQRSKGAART